MGETTQDRMRGITRLAVNELSPTHKNRERINKIPAKEPDDQALL